MAAIPVAVREIPAITISPLQRRYVPAQCSKCRRICADSFRYHIQSEWVHGPVIYSEGSSGMVSVYMEPFRQFTQMLCPECMRAEEQFHSRATWQAECKRAVAAAYEIDEERDAVYAEKHGSDAIDLQLKMMWESMSGCSELREWLSHRPEIAPGRVGAAIVNAEYQAQLRPSDWRTQREAASDVAKALQWWQRAMSGPDLGSITETAEYRRYIENRERGRAAIEASYNAPYEHPAFRPGTHKHDLYYTGKYDAHQD